MSNGTTQAPIHPDLFNADISNVDANLLEQYKLYVQTASTASTIRSQANNFFLAINALIVTLIVGVVEFTGNPIIPVWILFGCIVGILVAASWWVLIGSYRDLNSARFIIIQELETHLPANIYRREWALALKERPRRRYLRQTDVEQTIPVLFAGLYILLILIIIFAKPLGLS